MHNDLTRISLVIALTAGTIYHNAVLVALAAVRTFAVTSARLFGFL
jgi:hypothetical protein